jgi:hypothetical protein
MGRKSKIENHPDQKTIIKRLASGDEFSDIIRDFPDLTWNDLDYYKKNKLPELLSKSSNLKSEIECEQGDNALTEVKALQAKAMEILGKAEEAGDLKTALLGIREARSCLELCLKAEGQLKDSPQITIINNPEWVELRTLIVAALDPYPEAKEAVVLAIRGR